MAANGNEASGPREAIHLTVSGDSSAAEWCRPLAGDYTDRLQLRNKRRCFTRHDGAQVYWDDGRKLSRGWWIETQGRTHYAYHGGEDLEVPKLGWTCPGMIGFYTSVDIRIEVKVLVVRSIVKFETTCMHSLCHALGDLCTDHTTPKPSDVPRPPKPSAGRSASEPLAPPAADPARPRVRTRSISVQPSEVRPGGRGPQDAPDAAAEMSPSSSALAKVQQAHVEHWPTVKRKLSDGTEVAKTRGKEAAVHCHAFATDPETHEWVATKSGHAKSSCAGGLKVLIDGLIACCEGDEWKAEQTTRAAHPITAPLADGLAATVAAVEAKGVLAVVSDAVSKGNGGDGFGMHVSRGVSTSNDQAEKKQAFEEKSFVSMGGTPWGVGVVCRKGCRGVTDDAANGDAAFAIRVPGELSFYLVATGQGPQGHLNAEIAKDLLPAVAARDARLRTAGAVDVLRAAFAGAVSRCPVASSAGAFAATMIVLDHAKNELTVAHSGDCAACVCHDVGTRAVGAPEEQEATPLAEAAMPSAHDAPAVRVARPLQNTDRAVVLGSPGVWARTTPSAAAAFIRKFPPEDAQAAAEAFFRDTQARWAEQPAEDGRVPDLTILVAYTAREPRLS